MKRVLYSFPFDYLIAYLLCGPVKDNLSNNTKRSFRHHIFVFLILCNPLILHAQWYPVSVPTTAGLEKITFTDTLHGYCPLWDGNMLETNDGGMVWYIVPTGISGGLADVCFPTALIGYSVGDNGEIIKTTNAGATWSAINSPTYNVLRGVYFFNPDTGFICGQSESIYRTTNGGTTWVQQTSGAYWLRQFTFPTPQTGYCAGDGHKIYKTINGGLTWNLLPGAIGINLFDIQFVTADSGYIGGLVGYVAKSFNGGLTWQVLPTGTPDSIVGLWYFNPQSGYCVGTSGLILNTNNGGTTWLQETSGTTNPLYKCYFFNPNKGFICGSNGTLLRLGNCFFPSPGPITGPTPVCPGDSGKIYSVNPVTGATGYHWNVPPGVIITSGNNTNSITVKFSSSAVSGSFSVYAFNTNCPGALSPPFFVTVNPSPVPTISGPSPVCLNSNNNTYTTQAGMNNYIWFVSGGGTITSGGTATDNTVTILWTAIGAQTVGVNYHAPNGCPAVNPTIFNVTVKALPVPTITGPTPVCLNSTETYITQTGMTNYIWSVSAGGIITSGGTATDNTITIAWTALGAQTVGVNYHSSNGCTAANSTIFNVTVNALPVPTISGPTPVCLNSSGNTYSTQPGMTNYIWSVSAGGIITYGGTATDNIVTISWTVLGAQTVSVNYHNPNGCTATNPTIFNITVNTLPVPTITGPSPVCLNSPETYITQTGMTNYIWSVSSGGTIIFGGTATDNTVTISWTATGAQTVSVNYHNPNGCTAANPTIFNVTVNALPVPTLTGPTPVCLNSSGNTYSTQPGMTNYIWSVSAGGVITSGGTATDNTVTISWTAMGAQTVSVNYHNPNGCTAANPTIFNITVNVLPVPTITGPSPVCLNSPGTYITQTGMTNYIWSVSSGGTIIFGGTATDNTVTISWTATGAQTVSVNYHNPNGCTAANPTIFNVTVNALPVPTLTGPTPVCLNSSGNTYSTQAGMNNYIWSVSAGGVITSGGTATDNTITISWTAIGGQTVSVNYHNPNGCTAANPVIFNVTVNSLPVPTITGPTPVCLNSSGNTYSTQPGMTNYIWSVSAGGVITSGGTATDNTVTISWTAMGAQTVSVNYHGPNGCTAANPTIFNVTINALPVPTITGPTSVCLNSTETYITQTGMTNYIWSVSSGGTIIFGGTATDNTVTISWTAIGAQTVSVNYHNPNGCNAANPTIFNVTVNALPVPTLTGPTPVCLNSSGNTYSTQPGMTNYIWSVSAGGVITSGGTTADSTVTISWTALGVQTVSVNYHDLNGCIAANPSIFNVIVDSLPVPTVTGPTPVCLNSSGNTYSTQPGMTSYIWSVSAGGGITSGGTATDNAVTITWTVSGAQTVSVNYYNSNGCTATYPTTYSVTVNPLPQPAIAGPTPICLNSTNNVYSTQTGMSDYNWSVSSGGTITAGGTATDSTITITWTAPGSQTVSVNYHDHDGCVASNPAIFNVTVNSLPSPTIEGHTPICLNSTETYITQTGMTNYIWSVSSGGTILSGGTATDNTVTITWMATGTQTIGVNYHDPHSCTAANPAVFNIYVNTLPLPVISGPNPVCLNSSENTYITQPGMFNYLWSVSCGGIITSGGSSFNSSITIMWTMAGTQTVSVNFHDSNGCTVPDPTVYNVIVNPLPLPTITGPTPVCFDSTNNIYSTQPAMTNYIWSTSAGGTITSGGSETDNTITITWSLTGSQTVTVNYNTPEGCKSLKPAIFSILVNALPGPAGNITGPQQHCTATATETFSVDTISFATTYPWQLPPAFNIINGLGTNSITVSIDTSFISGDIYVYGINSCGDGALSLPFHFISQRSPVVDAGPDQVVPYDSNTKLNGSITGGSGTYSWLWQPSALLTEDTLLDPETVKLNHDTLFILMVTDLLNGCKDTDSVRIKVLNPEINEDCLVFHNVITPNGDGLNDKWIIDCIENFPDNKVIIFNRWGDIVNKFDNYDNLSQVWQGTRKDGKSLPDGTYYYVLTIKSGGNYCGWILLRGIF